MYRILIRPLLFLLPSEPAHQVAMGVLSALSRLPFGTHLIALLFGTRFHGPEKTVAGLHFPNLLGIAAGFDKDGRHIAALAALGFGHIEIGTVTPRPQTGNPKPRLFRLRRSHALINRMGFNNAGCIAIAHRLEAYSTRNFILGANIGKNKNTPNADAVDDYMLCFDTLHAHVDYFVINVSSPNTPGLRELQDREPLTRILEAILQRNAELDKPLPILLKIAPDLTEAQLDDIITMCHGLRLSGLVVSNTTISREGLSEDPSLITTLGAGGVSGRPLREKALEMVRSLRRQLPQEMAIIGVGGIDSAEAAVERLHAGATLVQIYTGFIYEGPGLVRRILRRCREEYAESSSE